MTAARPDAAGGPAAASDMAGPLLPRYGESTLADLGQSLLASLGVPGEPNALALPPAARMCLLVIDGLGWDLLAGGRERAPFLAGLMSAGRWLTAGFPATTVTSLSSLGTGRPPGQHGLAGYQVRVPATGRLLNGLRWDSSVDPVSWQPGQTIFERAAAAGVGAYRIARGSFERSGLSVAAMRGADYRAAGTPGALVAQTAQALDGRARGFAMVYTGDLDGTGHACGCASAAWQYQLRHADLLAEQLARALPPGTALYITADHGMVDVPSADRVDADLVTELRAGVALLGGEPRARHVYAEPGAAADVLATWRERLGDAAWVVSREEAVDEGWFGPVDRTVAARLGDVIAAFRGSSAVVATIAEPRESALVGMHGSLTQAEQRIPLLSCLAG
ncbi:MAG TPA: nucleotide pyrophosphatase/phosphodiesterase family protein [Streptosporangiaceae bacterium]|nr:nucleotide pyrophosphatase/phosphodiesterase family protein [Streptosporangiaceae bacterium]